MPDHDGDRPARYPPRTQPVTVITDARSAASKDISGRIRRYTITMAFRMACFVAMVFVGGWLRWVLLGCAVLLPYIAVVLANQSDQRSRSTGLQPGAPAGAPQLSAGDPAGATRSGHGEIVEGTVVADDTGDLTRADKPEGRVA